MNNSANGSFFGVSFLCLAALFLASACGTPESRPLNVGEAGGSSGGNTEGGDNGSAGGSSQTGGTNSGGDPSAGGSTNSGGSGGSDGSMNSGGSPNAGGMPNTGGTAGMMAGGSAGMSMGGMPNTGGMMNNGGAGGTIMMGGAGGTANGGAGGSGGTMMMGGTGGTMSGGAGGTMSGGAGGSGGGSDVTNGLIAYYPFDESDGDQALDASGNNNHGTLRAVGSGPLPVREAGRQGGALRFGSEQNRSRNYVEVPPNSLLDGLSTVYSVCAWVNLGIEAAAPDFRWYSFVSRLSGSGGQRDFHLGNVGIGPDQFAVAFETANGGSNYNVREDAEVPTRVWLHLCGVREAETLRLYTNGVLEDTRDGVVGSLGSTTNPLMIGLSQSDGGFSFQRMIGLIDEVRIYDRALSDSEIGMLSQ